LAKIRFIALLLLSPIFPIKPCDENEPRWLEQEKYLSLTEQDSQPAGMDIVSPK
jgi:hypothetical protein